MTAGGGAAAADPGATAVFAVKRIFSALDPDWLALRLALWPQVPRREHLAEMEAQSARPERHAAFVAYEGGFAVGLAEAAVRGDAVDGTAAAPVGFLEGLFVRPDARGRGAARELLTAVEVWVVLAGCRLLASDVDAGNEAGQEALRALGFEEIERLVFYSKSVG